ncbi:MAG TPA: sigma 54-interacting transcriptional regulator, partial [Kofleriaceae bacterium]|nr:sigma 54-interacting transcriptional regulator [Kofleriaceae bacterium]
MSGGTVTSVSRSQERNGNAGGQPHEQLILALDCERPMVAPSRHLIDGVDVVWFGRGERAAVRDVHDGLRRLVVHVPDSRMSSDHARLVRAHGQWLLQDRESKNGCLVNGEPVTRRVIDDGDVLELGRTLFLYRQAEVPAGTPDDQGADDAGGGALPATFVTELAQRFAMLARIAATDVPVLLSGETGTGKELVARALHVASARPGELVAVNCGGLTPTLVEAELFGHRRGAFSGAVTDRVGLIRSADRGTLFLDEIGDLPEPSQATLLRTLQEREVVPVGDARPIKVDIRLCAATHRDLQAMVDQGRFRQDLYARLIGLVIDLPPLRRRREDLGILIRALLPRIAGGERARFTPAAARRLFAYEWPLNIRELERCLGVAVALAGDRPIDV